MKWVLGLLILAGCSTSEPEVARQSLAAPASVDARENYDATFGVLVEGASGGPTYAAARIGNPWGRLDNFTSAGRGVDYPFEVKVWPYRVDDQFRIAPLSITPLVVADDGLAARIAADTASSDDAVRFAMAVSGSTFCRGGSVSLNRNVGTAVTSPGDIAAILAASQAAGRDVFPASVGEHAIPAVERLANSSGPGAWDTSRWPGWVVRLQCSLWRG